MGQTADSTAVDGDDITTGDQNTVQGTGGRQEIIMAFRTEKTVDHIFGSGGIHAHPIAGAGLFNPIPAPI